MVKGRKGLSGPMESAWAYAFTDYRVRNGELVANINDLLKKENLSKDFRLRTLDRALLVKNIPYVSLPGEIYSLAKSTSINSINRENVRAIDLGNILALERLNAIYMNSVDREAFAKTSRSAAFVLRNALEMTNGDLLGTVVLYFGENGAKRYTINRLGR